MQEIHDAELLTELVLKKAPGSSPKMTGSPCRTRHLMSVGAVVWKMVDINSKTQINDDHFP